MNKRPKRFDPRSKYVRYDKKSGLWITQRKRIYLYWFKFLRIAEQDPDTKLIGVNTLGGVVETIFLEQSLMSSGKKNGSHYLESK